MFYELRLYHANMGRIDDVAARMDALLPPIFDKHGFHQPLGQWRATAGAVLPMYIWMLGWDSWEQRNKAFAGIYGDSEWDKVRSQTNGPSEMVLRFNIQFMNPAPAQKAVEELFGDREGEVGGLHDLMVQEAYPGMLGKANQALIDVDLPAIKECGGHVLGVFNTESGLITPGLTWFVAWDNYEARQEGWKRYHAMESVQRQREKERSELNTHYMAHYTNYLLEPTEFCTPNALFASKD